MRMPDGPDVPATVGFSVRTFDLFDTYRHFNFLLGTARSLVERQPEAAIAVAQMAFESFVRSPSNACFARTASTRRSRLASPPS
jgi:hypothetical protein